MSTGLLCLVRCKALHRKGRGPRDGSNATPALDHPPPSSPVSCIVQGGPGAPCLGQQFRLLPAKSAPAAPVAAPCRCTSTSACWTWPAACGTSTHKASCTAVSSRVSACAVAAAPLIAAGFASAARLRSSCQRQLQRLPCSPRPQARQRAAQELPQQCAGVHVQAGRLWAKQVGGWCVVSV